MISCSVVYLVVIDGKRCVNKSKNGLNGALGGRRTSSSSVEWKYGCGGFSLGQTQYIDDLKEMQISAERRRNQKARTSDLEKTRLGRRLGHFCGVLKQTCPHIAAGVSLLLS